MPLIKSGSKEAVSKNIREMRHAGYPKDQAIAAALSTARRYGRKRADGGRTDFSWVEEGADPVGAAATAAAMRTKRSVSSARTPGPITKGLFAIGAAPLVWGHMGKHLIDSAQARADGGAATPWFTRRQANTIGHVGMLRSPVPGRTDKLPISVGSGSYVLPADIVSALGQGNSDAGAQILGSMFAKGPYGTAAPRLGGRRPRVMRAPSMSRSFRSPMRADGGAAPVDVIAAGGEYVLDPDQVAAVGGGDMGRGHRILDSFVEQVRKEHVKTLKKLPGPVRE